MTTSIFVYIAAIVISLIYNWLVSHLDRRRWTGRGMRALLVVGGVGYTLLLSALVVDAETVRFYVYLFAAALLPVLVGDLVRYQNRADATSIRTEEAYQFLEDFDQ